MSLKARSIVWGDCGIRCKVIGAFRDIQTGKIKIKVAHPEGERFITPAEIKGHELPSSIQCFKLGDRISDSRFPQSQGTIDAIENSCYRVIGTDRHFGGEWTTWIEFEFAKLQEAHS